MSSYLIFLLLLTDTFLADSYSYCFNNHGNFTDNSYPRNLDSALYLLQPTNNGGLLFNSSFGPAYALALCKGDAQLDECRQCIVNITIQLRTECPNQKQAVNWREECTLHYSDRTLLGIRALPSDPNALHVVFATQNATDPDAFMANLRAHLYILKEQAAANGGPLRKVGYGSTVNGSQHIYAMVQCSPDLSTYDCDDCLLDAILQIPIRGGRWKRGGSVYLISCTIRYETYLFYNQTRLLQLSTTQPQPEFAPQPPGNNTTRTRTIIIVVASIAAASVIAALVFVWILLRRRNRGQFST